MNILFYDYIERYNPVGESTHINEVLHCLSEMGHNIISLNSNSADGKAGNTDSRRPSVWQRLRGTIFNSRLLAPAVGEFSIIWHLLNEIRVLFSALKVMARQSKKIDVIYRRHSLYSSEYLVSRLFKTPLVKEVNGIVVDEVKVTTRADRFSLWLIDRIERFSMPKADAIIVVTSKLEGLLVSEYGVEPDKISVIQNGANIDLFSPMDGTILRKKLVCGMTLSVLVLWAW